MRECFGTVAPHDKEAVNLFVYQEDKFNEKSRFDAHVVVGAGGDGCRAGIRL
jgi:hypothetical protein